MGLGRFRSWVAAMVSCGVLWSAPGLAGDFALEDLQKLVADPKVRSPEDLIARLPNELRSNFTLVRDSRSLQGATPQKPRAVLFGRDGKLILTFNGDPAKNGFDSIEVAQFRDKTASFEFREVRFPKSGRPHVSEGNPGKCMACHSGGSLGKDPRPNWQDYSQWPGFYGSNDDYVVDQEAAELRAFRKSAKEDLRYRHLIFEPGSDLAPYSGNYKGSIEDRPNFRLTMLLSRLNARRLARVLQDKRFDRFREPWLMMAMGCRPDEATAKRIEALIGAPLPQKDGGARILAQAGISTRDWSMRYRDETRPLDTYDYQEGFARMDQLVAHHLLEDLGKGDPKLEALYLRHKLSAPEPGNYELAQSGAVPNPGRVTTLDSMGIPARGLGAKDLCDALSGKVAARAAREGVGQLSVCGTTMEAGAGAIPALERSLGSLLESLRPGAGPAAPVAQPRGAGPDRAVSN